MREAKKGRGWWIAVTTIALVCVMIGTSADPNTAIRTLKVRGYKEVVIESRRPVLTYFQQCPWFSFTSFGAVALDPATGRRVHLQVCTNPIEETGTILLR